MKNFVDVIKMICYYAVATFVALVLFSFFMINDFLREIVDIYFFRLVLYSVSSSSVIMLLTFFIAHMFKRSEWVVDLLNARQIVSAFGVSVLMIHTFAGTVPFVSDRSYTIFSLAELYDYSDKVFTQQEVEEVFIDKFVIRREAVKKRLDEQLSTGYIQKIEDGYQISESGKKFIELLRFLNKFFPVSGSPSSIYPNEGVDY